MASGRRKFIAMLAANALSSVAFTCGSVHFTINRHRNYLKCRENCKIMKKIHLNRQSGMILASSSLIFDVISCDDGVIFPIYIIAVTIGSMLML